MNYCDVMARYCRPATADSAAQVDWCVLSFTLDIVTITIIYNRPNMPFWSRKPAPAVDEPNSSSGSNALSLSSDISASSDATSAQQGTGVGDGDGVLLSSPQQPQLSIPDNTLNGDNGSTSANVNATVSTSSEAWTKIFPEAFGIRQSIEDSSFRWCVRESMLWGVATGTMMGM